MPARSFAFPLLLVALLAPFSAMFAQKRIEVENLPNFDLHRFHFGFALSYNTSDFQMRMDQDSPFTDSLLVLEHQRQPGFNLGIVAS